MASVAEAAPKAAAAEIRVVDSDGTILAEHIQYTSKAKLKTDRRALCFTGGTGGSGKTVKVPGPTAFSLLADAAAADRDLDPLSVTDEFDFGLGLCGIGGVVAPETGFWSLSTGHAASETGGDTTPVANGDDVLWYLIEDFNEPAPDELVLKVPSVKAPVDGFEVQVLAYDSEGKKKPAKGAVVSGAAKPTDANGRTLVDADSDLVELAATKDGAIPSNVEVVCTVAAKACEPGYAETIAGTSRADRIKAGKPAETIIAGSGDDVVDATRGSAADVIDCGRGDDEVEISAAGEKRSKLKGCEQVG